MNVVSTFFEQGHTRNYGNGQIVLYQGEKVRDVFFITSGYVKVYDINAKSEEKILVLLGPGDLFPLVWDFEESSSLHYFYEIHQSSEIHVRSRLSVVKETQTSHEFAQELLKYFVNRTKDLTSRLESIEGTSAQHKVGQVLSYLTRSHGDTTLKTKCKILPTITHETIANMAGLARETVSIQMKDLADKKIVQSKDGNIVVNCNALDSFLEG